AQLELEALAGGAGMARRYARSGRRLTAAEIFAAAAAGEEEAGAAVDEHARAVARAICNVQNLLDPELVVLGGGIGGRSDFLELVRAHVRELRDHPPVVVSSALGEWAGAVGAAELALGETERAAAHA